MKLRVSLSRSGTHPCANLQITADALATVGDLATALAQGDPAGHHNGHGEPLTLAVLNDRKDTDRVVLPDASLLESGILSGSTIKVVGATAAPSPSGGAAAILSVVAGPDAGLSIPLPRGSSDIGRSANCLVRLTDPMVSKLHARVVVTHDVDVVDANSANGVIVGGVRVARTRVGSGEPIRLGETEVVISRSATSEHGGSSSTDIPFVRSPRVLDRPVKRVVELPRVPPAPDPPPFPWVAMIAPLVMGGILFALSSHRGLSLLFVGMSPVLMAGNYVAQRSHAASRHKNAVENFAGELDALEADLDAAHVADRAALQRMHPALTACLADAHDRGELLWSRRPEHREFLQVRLGSGDLPAYTTAEMRPTGGLPELALRARNVIERFGTLLDVPIVADLRASGGVGLCGPRDVLEDAARAVVAQVACLHSPAEVVLTCFTAAAGRQRWSWLEWLPHTASLQSPIPLHLSADSGSARVLLERLEEVVDIRGAGAAPALRGERGEAEDPGPPSLPSILVVVDDPLADRRRLTRLSERGPDVGVYVVWLTEDKARLPAACRTYLDLTNPSEASVGYVREGITARPVRFERLDTSAAASLARASLPSSTPGQRAKTMRICRPRCRSSPLWAPTPSTTRTSC